MTRKSILANRMGLIPSWERVGLPGLARSCSAASNGGGAGTSDAPLVGATCGPATGAAS
ncbi:hypothetical protein [Coralliovum pocilloporae]|uniref:hypothetical protein n=1 Tax=Coralliovum pocilloporae TaxID=3066369 RepID=UPI0033075C16